MEFQIDDAYLSSINICKEWSIFDHIPKSQLTHDQLIYILKGKDRCTSVITDDHPEFSKFRDQLEADGYIIKGPKWNSDRVLKSFSVNGYRFDKGERFLCAAALYTAIGLYRKVIAESDGAATDTL